MCFIMFISLFCYSCATIVVFAVHTTSTTVVRKLKLSVITYDYVLLFPKTLTVR